MFTKNHNAGGDGSHGFSGWAQGSDNTQQNSNDAMVVTANRFPQPISSVLAPTTVVTRDDIDRWQSKSLTDVMRRLPGWISTRAVVWGN